MSIRTAPASWARSSRTPTARSSSSEARAEFEYRGTVPDTGEPFALPGIFVMRVRDGQIVSSRDYVDHLGLARALGRIDGLLTAVSDAPPASSA